MKAKRFFKCAAVVLCAATLLSGGQVFAAESFGEESYPSKFEKPLSFDFGITDYAVDGDNFAFATNTKIYQLTLDDYGERKLSEPYVHESGITKIDYSEGNLYFEASQQSYLYHEYYNSKNVLEQAATFADYEFLSDDDRWKIDLNGSTSYILDSETGNLSYVVYGNPAAVLTDDGESGFKPFSLKKYGDDVFALKDDKLYRIVETTAKLATPWNYTDFAAADNILVGDAAEQLKAPYEVTIGEIAKDVYCTKIDADRMDGKFTQLSTQRTNDVKPCLVLYERDGLCMIATNEGCYLTTEVTKTAYTAHPNDWTSDNNGRKTAYTVEKTGIYSRPFMSKSTRVGELEAGTKVTVTEKFKLDYINTVFYKVICDGEDGEVSGFIASNFLSPYSFEGENNTFEGGEKDDFEYKTNTVTVVLVVAIVGLVLIAVMYLYLKGAKGSKKSKNKKDKERTKRRGRQTDSRRSRDDDDEYYDDEYYDDDDE